jgi:hypothetical protein
MLVAHHLARSRVLPFTRAVRWASTLESRDKYKIVVVGGGMYNTIHCKATVSNLYIYLRCTAIRLTRLWWTVCCTPDIQPVHASRQAIEQG